ncbi:hypothetical protein [Acaryochloris sp. CCMEE 5410]|uniref:hypothetical protein n=1 Tax=Acaryochloris sp. CCMEE 5410 TaxID=310037 RepID=UPI000248394B|nr:hypothetical protein [Acaryochloris sp. CCMEE 5410]KAI9134689.1 hypothetical protein ON05_016400 [Acaryochloris sp. CCMEE 5410]
MTLAKKGSRKIVVDGVAYRWSIRHKPTYPQALCQSNLTTAVELYDQPGTTLIITWSEPRPDNWLMATSTSITPQHITNAIRQALRQGWEPALSGATYPLRLDVLPG